MKKYKVSEKFLLDGHKEACDKWKKRIEDEVPELFERELGVGRWYKDSDGSVFFVEKWKYKKNKVARGYGFVGDNWVERPIGGASSYYFISRRPVEAKEEKVKSALIAEAERRGYDRAYAVNCLSPLGSDKIVIKQKPVFKMHNYSLWIEHDGEAICIFLRGKWAEIIEQPEDKDDEKETLRNQVAELSRQIEKLKKQIG